MLFVVDNSRGMADKQAALSTAAGELVARLANPLCVDPSGVPQPTQPELPTDACRAGAAREFSPVTDMHVGAISTSIGGHGSDACRAPETSSCPGGVTNTSNDDRGHLLTRRDPCADGKVPTYQDLGFLAWDPTSMLAPPGEASLSVLRQSIGDIVEGAGEVGCGYESSLEAWYRFLVDPNPYASIAIDGTSRAVGQGTDSVLLGQRGAFLRSSSLLLVIWSATKTTAPSRSSASTTLPPSSVSPTRQKGSTCRARARSARRIRTIPAVACAG